MASKHTFQAPRGTRDFYPEDMAIRRYIESVWREVSINHGFDEIEGPMFEHLDLYTVKSGEGIVNELFSFTRAGGDTQYALRPEFTPTLARMYAAKARQLPKPTKWFVIPNHFRAERPQRGRLREFMQWNIDVIGDDSPAADAEIIACTIRLLERYGLTPQQVKIRLSDRNVISKLIKRAGASDEVAALGLLDKRDRIEPDVFQKKCDELGFELSEYDRDVSSFTKLASGGVISLGGTQTEYEWRHLRDVMKLLAEIKLDVWCEVDFRIVRGLAYYTGTVFEVHEASGKERAIAGGGRYDGLIDMFGGPPTPAVGIAMGDVVLRLVLEDHGLLEPARKYMPQPDVFVVSLGDEAIDSEMKKIVARLRRENLHVRHSYKSTRKLKKLLGEAEGLGSRLVIILDEKLAQGEVTIKDMEQGSQEQVRLDNLRQEISDRLK